MGEAKQRRSLPSLRDWLAKNLTSNDAPARDGMADFADWVQRMLDHPQKPETTEQTVCLLMTQASSLAIIESCNHARHQGMSTADILAHMCRCLGASFGYAMMSLEWKENAPIRQLSRPMAEHFLEGVKFAIDECLNAAGTTDTDAGGRR